MFFDDQEWFMFPEEELGISQSPAEEVAKERSFTDRTSRLAFTIEKALHQQHDRVIKPFLFLPAFVVERAVFRISYHRHPVVLPLGKQGGVYGYYAPPGIELQQWKHEDGTSFQDLTEFPRLLITANISKGDFPLDVFCESYQPDKVGCGFVRFTPKPLMLLASMNSLGEIRWDWSDVKALDESSFRHRLVPLLYSVRQLLDPNFGIIPCALYRIEGRDQDPTQREISARL